MRGKLPKIYGRKHDSVNVILTEVNDISVFIVYSHKNKQPVP